MPAIDIPDPLPPSITPPRTVIEFLVDQDLEEFGGTGLVARTWYWVLHGGGPGPISHMDWSQFDGDGPPSAATLATESTAVEPPLHAPAHGPNSTRPDSSAGCAPPTKETKYRYASARGKRPPSLPSLRTDRSPLPCARSPVGRRPDRGDGEDISIRSSPNPSSAMPDASSSFMITAFPSPGRSRHDHQMGIRVKLNGYGSRWQDEGPRSGMYTIDWRGRSALKGQDKRRYVTVSCSPCLVR
jgi:hypothetical protein